MHDTIIGNRRKKVKGISRKAGPRHTRRPGRRDRREKQIQEQRLQKRVRKARMDIRTGPAGSLVRRMLDPLASAIELALTQQKEKSWFPRLPMLAQIVCGLLYHLFALPSMRATLEKVNHCPSLNLGHVSLSTFSDSINSRRRLKVIRAVYQNLLTCFGNRLPPQFQKFRHVAAIDSTLIHCVLSAAWAQYRKAVQACKAHMVFDLVKGIPKSVLISAAKVHDRKYFEVFLKKGWTYIVDRAYNDYSLFDAMIDLHIFFVTRLKSSASYRIVEKKHVKRKHRKAGVRSDQIIRLGAGTREMLNNLRLVVFEAEDGEVFEFLTNRFDLAPTSIAALYRARWSIELFFKFFKRTLRGVRLLGRSEVAAEIHVLIALITDVLLKCLAKAIRCWKKVKRHVPASFIRVLREYLFQPWCHELQVILAATFT